jgi:sterol desaturase/sphingolipid hydroxylase (fatty acid hydroxylase superfamily)
MSHYWDLFLQSFTGYASYLKTQIMEPSWHNYFWWLVGLSLAAWLLEIVFPWRKNQGVVRKDFWMDGFYMFFNFYIFTLIGYTAISNVFAEAFNDFLGIFGIENLVAINVSTWPTWSKFVLMFVVADFVQWNIHRLLHRVNWLWEFHKVHHSVEEMGFAAHLRYHWMESVVYKTLQYIPLAMLGFGLTDFFIVHIFTIAIGHLNHSNLNISWGPLKYVFNSPNMHIWHHAKELPEHPFGANFGLSLSVWDYLFKTVYWPNSGRDVKLGFEGMEEFPKDFVGQITYPLSKKKG